MSNIKNFPQSVIEKLNYYVYILIDPINDENFYVGKGTGNRIFAHINDSLKNPMKTDKIDRIHQINKNGHEVRHIILRHGLTEKEAFEVEASAIDLLEIKKLTNIVSGHDSAERGLMSAEDAIMELRAEKIYIVEPSILFRVNTYFKYGMTPDELYEITRGNWGVGVRREKAKYAFCVYRGLVRQVYLIHRWFPVKARSKESKKQKRWRFDGEISEELSHYIGGEVGHYAKKGSRTVFRYLNC
jgi:hypothetical protein